MQCLAEARLHCNDGRARTGNHRCVYIRATCADALNRPVLLSFFLVPASVPVDSHRRVIFLRMEMCCTLLERGADWLRLGTKMPFMALFCKGLQLKEDP